MLNPLGGNAIHTLASGVELSDLVDCVEECRVLIIFRASNEAKTERVRLPLVGEALGSIA